MILSSGLLLLLGLTAQAQLRSKTFTETFPVDQGTQVRINTSHADLEFETWDRDQVEVTVLLELEGASEEEAETFFDRELVKVMGNSKEIEISTLGHGPFTFDFKEMDLALSMVPDLSHMMEDFQLPEIPEIAPLPNIATMPPLLAVPPFPMVEFDYEAYQKDKEKYLKQWQKEFEKSFDQEYKEKFEKWGQEMAEKAELWEQRREKMEEQREKLQIKREQRQEELQKKMNEKRKELAQKREEIHKKRKESAGFHAAPNVFYFSSDGKNKEYKVKKRIKIKMPKYLNLDMNVRHGEVKLAANAKNINANLVYSSLLASTIEGNQTDIQASYSPISVQNWDYGKLSTDYSDRVNLKVVGALDLRANASQVVIGKLIDRAKLRNRFGSLSIEAVSDDFAAVDISVENGALEFNLPTAPFVITVRETGTDFQYPQSLKLETSGTSGTKVLQGYHLKKNDDKAITINTKYSEVVLMD